MTDSRKRKASNEIPWLAAVERIKDYAMRDDQRHKIGHIFKQPDAVEYLIAWEIVNRDALRYAPTQSQTSELPSLDETWQWVWEECDPQLVSAMVGSAAISSGLTNSIALDAFDICREMMLLYPDGTIHPEIMREHQRREDERRRWTEARTNSAARASVKAALETSRYAAELRTQQASQKQQP